MQAAKTAINQQKVRIMLMLSDYCWLWELPFFTLADELYIHFWNIVEELFLNLDF